MARKSEDEETFRWLEVDWSDVAFLIRKHFGLLLLVPVLGLLLAWFAASSLRPVFSTTAVIYLRPNFDREMQLEQTHSKLEDADSLRSMERAMVSDSVILRTVVRLGLRDDADFLDEEVPPTGMTDAKVLSAIRGRYAAELVPNTRLVELTVEDFSPARAALIADTLVEEFLKHLYSDKGAKETELRALLIAQSERALKGALASEEKLTEFRTTNPGTIVEQDSGIFQERLMEHGKALNEATSEMSRLAAMKASLQSVDTALDPYPVFQILNNRNSEHLSALLTMHAAAKSDFAAVTKRVTESHPAHHEAESRLAEVNQSLLDYAEEMKNGVESEYEAARERTAKLNEALVALQQDLVGFKSASAEFRGLKAEIDRHWNTYTRLQQKIMDLDVGPEGTPTFATVISRAVVPDKKAKPRGLFWAAGGVVLGGLIALGQIFRRHRYGLPFTSGAQPNELLGIPTIAELETAKSTDFGRRISRLAGSPQMMNLLIALRGLRLVQVTSLSRCPDEVLLPLALSRASGSHGARTLLLVFRQAPEQPAETRLNVSTNVTMIELSPDLFLHLPHFNSLITDWLGDYDRIVIDTTRVLEIEAKLAMGQVANASLIAVSAGQGEPRSEHRRFVELCSSRGISQVGSVYLRTPSADPRHARPRTLAVPGLRRRFFQARPVSA